MTKQEGKLAILVGGGPAPGINSVIATATIRSVLEGYEVVGLREGFRWIMQGDVTKMQPLDIESVSRIHFRGGSILGTARDNPTTDDKRLDNVVASLDRLGVDKLITIGGDDTAYSAHCVEERAGGRLRVVHVPKTIDNDLDLPHGIDTFGYQTARHVGVWLVKNLMLDAKTSFKWYLVISMGRKAGHLALGIGKAAGATVTIIPEEFPEPKIRLSHIVDIIVGTIIKRRRAGRYDGVAILAEGLVERLDPQDFGALNGAKRDEHGHLRLGDMEFSPLLKEKVSERLRSLGLSAPMTTKLIGYELRCADPTPYDMEYTRDLGFCAAQYIIIGGTGAIVSIDNARFKPLKFTDMMDPETKRFRVRMVDIASESYHVARRYMLRLKKQDFEDKNELAELAKVCGMTPAQFQKEFYYLIENDVLTRLREKEKADERPVDDVRAPM